MDYAVLKANSTLLIFSDTHLTHTFDQKKFHFLVKLIEQADNVVINGDLWDYYLTTWDQLVESPWKQLFPLLKKKNTVYIYGNHDQKHHSDERVSLFSTHQTDKYMIKSKDKLLNIQHGHLIVPGWENSYSTLRNSLMVKIGEKFEEWNVLLISRKVLGQIEKHQNNQLKKYAITQLGENEILICGHTHLMELNEASKYANVGLIHYGQAQALLVKNGELTPIKTTY